MIVQAEPADMILSITHIYTGRLLPTHQRDCVLTNVPLQLMIDLVAHLLHR
jgi:hypothetical protein